MDRLLDYVARFDPRFVGRIRGASESEIEGLQRLAGERLPGSYRDWLRRMGLARGTSVGCPTAL
jgi:hypothetical protein